MRFASILLVVVFGLIGCKGGGKPWATKYEFERDKAACIQQEERDYPIRTERVLVRTDTECRTGAYGNVKCTSEPVDDDDDDF